MKLLKRVVFVFGECAVLAGAVLLTWHFTNKATEERIAAIRQEAEKEKATILRGVEEQLGKHRGIVDWSFLDDIKSLQKLIDQGVDVVNGGSKDGWTLLHSAAFWGKKEVVELLIAKGAEVNARDGDGWTALHAAAQWNRKEVAELLLGKGAEVNARDNTGWTALHLATYWGYKDVAELLLGKGAEVNAKDEANQAPLYWAVQGGHKEVAELLQKHGGRE